VITTPMPPLRVSPYIQIESAFIWSTFSKALLFPKGFPAMIHSWTSSKFFNASMTNASGVSSSVVLALKSCGRVGARENKECDCKEWEEF
jgi:hypothetical protein